jgi:geranylgeranyl pyrophosphate synthase
MPPKTLHQASSTTVQHSEQNAAIADWKKTLALITDDLKAVKESLLAIIPPQTDLLSDTVSGSLNSGGKYLRPAITLLMGKALQSISTSQQWLKLPLYPK